MTKPKACRQETLAQSGFAHVQRCIDCACVSLHLGPLTIRLDDTSLESLWAVLGEAAMELHKRKLEDIPHRAERGALGDPSELRRQRQLRELRRLHNAVRANYHEAQQRTERTSSNAWQRQTARDLTRFDCNVSSI